jgi:MtN3 and saliva related transmembrane protein
MMRQETINFIGYVAATCTTVSFSTAVDSRGEAALGERHIAWYVLHLLHGDGFVMTYGLLAHSKPVAAANAVTFVLSMSILVLKLHFDREAVKEVGRI